MEYCRYILTKDASNQDMHIDFGRNKKYLKTKFFEELSSTITGYKKAFEIKDKNFSYEKMLVKTIERFFYPDLLFMKCERDESVDRLYQHTKRMFKAEQNKVKNGQEISYDNMFEIITNFSILFSNTLLCVEDENNIEKIIRYQSIDIDVLKICSMIQQSLKIITKQEKYKGKVKKYDAILRKIPTPMLAIGVSAASLKLVGLAVVLSLTLKTLWDVHHFEKAYKNGWIYSYFFYVLMATYTRNEELKGMFNYG